MGMVGPIDFLLRGVACHLDCWRVCILFYVAALCKGSALLELYICVLVLGSRIAGFISVWWEDISISWL